MWNVPTHKSERKIARKTYSRLAGETAKAFGVEALRDVPLTKNVTVGKADDVFEGVKTVGEDGILIVSILGSGRELDHEDKVVLVEHMLSVVESIGSIVSVDGIPLVMNQAGFSFFIEAQLYTISVLTTVNDALDGAGFERRFVNGRSFEGLRGRPGVDER